jgi:hypothetical protein
VHVPSGEVIRNVIGLCWRHHEDVTGKPKTGHVAWVQWAGGREFRWLEQESTSGKWKQIGTLSLPAPSETPTVPDGAGGREAERCPTCGRLRRKSEPEHDHEPRPKRPRQSWTIQVPADQEDGAAILDELIEGCAEVFGHETYTSTLRRYFTTVAALALVLQNRELIQAEVDA